MDILGRLKMSSEILLVNDNDEIIGQSEKIKIHKEGLLHRAFSIILFNTKGKMLIQKRASSKYHSGGLWTNACCSHHGPNEELEVVIHKRLKEEMGIDCDLKKIFSFRYYAVLDNDMIENEIDHVFIGQTDKNPLPNPEEVQDYKWMSINSLKEDITKNPERYTVWFKILLMKYLNKKQEILQEFFKNLPIDSIQESNIISLIDSINKYFQNPP